MTITRSLTAQPSDGKHLTVADLQAFLTELGNAKAPASTRITATVSFGKRYLTSLQADLIAGT